MPRKAAARPEQAAALRARLADEARDHADHDRRPQFQRVMSELSAQSTTDTAHARDLACLTARGGDLEKALRLVEPLNDPSATAAVTAHAADRAVRRREPNVLPADLHAGYEAMLTAFEKYDAGDDDAARVALNPIGLRSPFLEWKVLLRGLIAYTAGDDARAVENWQRLSPDRLPAKLAAPFRARIDADFSSAQPKETAAKLAQQYRAMSFRGLIEPLERLRAELGRDRPLSSAYRHAEAVLPILRRVAPELEPKLARGFYRAILDHGDPADLPKYRQLFGAPADDPEFHRLQALAYEGADEPDTANRHWAAYEAWLAGGPPGWPSDLAARARAIVLVRMGRNAAKQAEDEELDNPLDLFYAPPRGRRKPRKPADPKPFFRRAADLAPDWPDPARELVNRLTAAGELVEAETVGRRLIDRAPTAAGVLEPLAAALQRSGRAADALDLRAKALAANPLDKRTRVMAACSYLAAARRAVIDGNAADAEPILERGRTVCLADTPAGFHALRSLIARKLKRTADADAARDAALAAPGGRLAALFFLSVDGTLAKLKPAERRPADQALAAAWTGPAAPREANLLYGAWDQYHLEGIHYRGQPSQEKKVHAVCLAATDGDGPEHDFEVLAEVLAFRHEWAIALKVATKLRERFPKNPVFPLMIAESEFGKGDGRPSRKVAVPLRHARILAEASPEPRHKATLDRVAKLEAEVDPDDFFDLFRFFDRGRR